MFPQRNVEVRRHEPPPEPRLLSAGIVIFSCRLQDLKADVFFFWASLIGAPAAFLLAWPIEDWMLPDNTKDWVLFVTHCFCAALFIILSWLPLYFVCVFVTSLSYNTCLVFFFFIQWAVLGDIPGPPGVYVEVFGAVLIVVSSFLVPVYDFAVDSRKCNEQKHDGCEETMRLN